MRIQRKRFAWRYVVIAPMLLLLNACGTPIGGNSTSSQPAVIKVVAAENFYGDIVKQLGGSNISVTSILSDPDADPHEYESSVQDGIAVTQARLVIENSSGYDTWMDKLLSAAPNASRVVLKAYAIAPIHLPDNPHIWYSFDDARAVARAIASTLKQLSPSNAPVFEQNLQAFEQSLQQLQQKQNEIKNKYVNTPVGLTETIYLYQSTLEGLNVLTPFEFEKAIAEGNDPPADTVITATNQISNKQIKVLIYNQQTVTPITTHLQNEAQAQGIPIVPVSESMPAGKTYQSWMMDQLNALETALGG